MESSDTASLSLPLESPPSTTVPQAPPAPTVAPVSLVLGPQLFFNRELSWLEFNQRVLDEARDPSVPLLERLKFLVIVSGNLDEFFMVRVAGLIKQRAGQVADVTADGLTAPEQLNQISLRVRRMFDDISTALRQEILPELSAQGVRLLQTKDLGRGERTALHRHFREQVMPVLTPLAIDPGHPFPHLRNKSLNLIAMLAGAPRQEAPPAFAVVQVPSVLPRLVPIDASAHDCRAGFVLLDEVIAAHIGDLFPGFRCLGAWPFRIVRNFDLSIDEEEAEDLLESVQQEVRRRDRGAAIHMTLDVRTAAPALEMLRHAIGVEPAFVYPLDVPLNIPDLGAMAVSLEKEVGLRDDPVKPQVLPPLRDADDIFELVAQGDVLQHHPYESFDPVVGFIEAAAIDPDVLAIKQTLYRTSGDSPITKALMRAAENGKQVTALIEIKARFDEENNINWARKLEEAGVHVVYGLVGLKTHCKVALVVRREKGLIKRYVHLGTGNYNPTTARLYTDLSFFTSRPDFGEDATSLFNLLTSCTAPPTWKKLTVAPLGLHERILGLIERETQNAREGRPARIIAKMNALVDPDVIISLYRASQAGVRIDLIVRGICCLKPALAGLSERIRVISVVDRFLEHSRIFYFEAGGAREVYAASADWMPRNFHRRVEVMFPIEDEALKVRVIDAILEVCMADNVKARRLRSDGVYERTRPAPGEPPRRSQKLFLDRAREVAERADTKVQRDRPFIVRPVRNLPTKEPEQLALEVARDDTGRVTRPPGEPRQ